MLKISFTPSSISSRPKQLILSKREQRLVLFDHRANDSVQDAQTTRQEGNYVYTITSIRKTQAGQYFVYCYGESYSDGLVITVTKTSMVEQNGKRI